MKTPARLRLAQLPTPLEPLDRLSEEIGTRIWIKRDDLTDSVAGGNKIRKLEFSIAQAMAEEAGVLVTWGAIQSNHCRATAVLAARLGLKSHLVLRGDEPAQADGNLLIARLVGAEITFASPGEYRNMDRTYARLAAYYADRGLKTCRIPVGASDEIGLWGYIECARELKQDLAGLKPDAVVSATGSGGTLGGLIIGNAMHGLDTEIFGFNVFDDAACFAGSIEEDFSRWRRRYEAEAEPDPGRLPVNVINGYVNPGYGQAPPEVYRTIHRLARLEGIVLDPVYTGKAFHGMLQQIRAGRFRAMSNIVFIHTGGMPGLFPQKEKLFETCDI